MAQSNRIRRGQSIPASAEVAEIVQSCVHCGLCNSVCPTYRLERDERDGPRGRILLIEQMFRSGTSGRAPTLEERRHIGRCLSCLACTTACPTGVDYGHLIGHAKAYLRDAGHQTLRERVINWFAAALIPFPERLKWGLKGAPVLSRLAKMLHWAPLRELAALTDALPNIGSNGRAAFSGPGTAATTRERRARVLLLAGCAQQVLRPGINDSMIRLLARSGIDVEVSAGVGCCGASTLDIGDTEATKKFARANIDAWMKSLAREDADAIVFSSAGCGATVKDYAHLLRADPVYAENAAKISSLARDVAEFLGEVGLGPPRRWSSLKVAYVAPCRLQHGQGVFEEPVNLIHEAGFTVIQEVGDSLCCGGAGTYAFREPEVADALRGRKVVQLQGLRPDVIATDSIACLTHMEQAVTAPIVHTVELLDWAHGGPVPRGLAQVSGDITDIPGPPPLDVEDYIRT